jgi:MinD superfamily P-loop ATPase
MKENLSGRWFMSNTQYGPLVHTRLGIALENSGKLVALVRQQAGLLAKEQGFDYIISDGPRASAAQSYRLCLGLTWLF